jgi:hypothetical protein
LPNAKRKSLTAKKSVRARSLQNLVPYRPGQSGNPGGRTVAFAECQSLAREASPYAMNRLIGLIASEDERVALMAADKVLERAWGKPKEQKDDDYATRLAAMTDEQRRAEAEDLLTRARAVLANRVIEGEATEVERRDS